MNLKDPKDNEGGKDAMAPWILDSLSLPSLFVLFVLASVYRTSIESFAGGAPMTRREFLGAVGKPAALGVVAALDPLGLRNALARVAAYAGSAAEAAADESFWFDIQQAFTLDRSVINLNNG